MGIVSVDWNYYYIRKFDYTTVQNKQMAAAGKFEENFHRLILSLLFQILGRGVLERTIDVLLNYRMATLDNCCTADVFLKFNISRSTQIIINIHFWPNIPKSAFCIICVWGLFYSSILSNQERHSRIVGNVAEDIILAECHSTQQLLVTGTTNTKWTTEFMYRSYVLSDYSHLVICLHILHACKIIMIQHFFSKFNEIWFYISCS